MTEHRQKAVKLLKKAAALLHKIDKQSGNKLTKQACASAHKTYTVDVAAMRKLIAEG